MVYRRDPFHGYPPSIEAPPMHLGPQTETGTDNITRRYPPEQWRLPNRRPAITVTLEVEGQRVEVIIGVAPEGGTAVGAGGRGLGVTGSPRAWLPVASPAQRQHRAGRP